MIVIKSIVVLFLLTALSAAQSYHSSDFNGVFATVPNQISQELEGDHKLTRGEVLASGDAASVFSFGQLQPFEIKNATKRADVLSVPIAEAGLCLGYNASYFGQEIAFTVDEVGWLFRGTGTPITLNPNAPATFNRYLHTNTKIFISEESHILLEELVAKLAFLVEVKEDHTKGSVDGDDPGYTGPLFDIPSVKALMQSGKDVEDVFKMNPNIKFVDTDAEAVALAKSTPNAVALITSVSSLHHRLRCAGIRTPHPQYLSENLQVSVRPYLTGATMTLHGHSNNVVRLTSTLQPITPLTVTAYLHISKSYACEKDDNQWFAHLNEIIDGNLLLNWNLVKPTIAQTFNAVSELMHEGLCSATKDLEARGASSAVDVVSAWNLVYLQAKIAAMSTSTSTSTSGHTGEDDHGHGHDGHEEDGHSNHTAAESDGHEEDGHDDHTQVQTNHTAEEDDHDHHDEEEEDGHDDHDEGEDGHHDHDSSQAPLTGNEVFLIHYQAENSGRVLESLKDHPETFSVNLMITDIPPTPSEFHDVKHLSVTPLAAWPLSIVYNLKSVTSDELILPFCAVVDIFAGVRRFWDDEEIADANPTILMPHEPIRIVARSGSSGATHVLFQGLAAIGKSCSDHHLTEHVLFTAGETNDFNASAATSKSGVIFADSTKELLRLVDNTPFSVGYAFSPGTQVPKATLQDENHSPFHPEPKEVSTVLQASSLSSQNVLSIPRNGSLYPFVGVSYAVYLNDISTSKNAAEESEEEEDHDEEDADHHDEDHRRRAEGEEEESHDDHGAHEEEDTDHDADPCVPYEVLFTFIQWSIQDKAAVEVSASVGYTPLPAAMATLADTRLRSVQCNGHFILPQFSTSKSTPQWLIAIYVGIPIAALATLGILKIVFSGKSNRYAPKNSSCCIVFTDIESSTTLWGRVPDLMGAALDLHNDVIRKCIGRNKVYEVKTIGDSFMVAAETAEQGMQFALDVQQALMDAPWDEEAVEEFQKTYCELHAEKGWALVQSDVDPSLWRGLRIRVAVNYGEVTTSQDPQHHGYDYHGPTVNKAARLESIGHGGQIIVSKEIAETNTDFLNAKNVIQHKLDDVLLRGMDEEVGITQISSSRFSRRQFATLRLEKQRDHSDSENTGDTVTAVASSHGQGGVDLSEYPSVNAYAMLHTLLGPLKPSKAKALLDVLTAAWRVPMESVKSAKVVMAHKVGSAAGGLENGGFGAGNSINRSRTRGSMHSMSRSGSESLQGGVGGGKYRVHYMTTTTATGGEGNVQMMEFNEFSGSGSTTSYEHLTPPPPPQPQEDGCRPHQQQQ